MPLIVNFSAHESRTAGKRERDTCGIIRCYNCLRERAKKKRAKLGDAYRKSQTDRYWSDIEMTRAEARGVQKVQRARNRARRDHGVVIRAACRLHIADYDGVVGCSLVPADQDARATAVAWLVCEERMNPAAASAWLTHNGRFANLMGCPPLDQWKSLPVAERDRRLTMMRRSVNGSRDGDPKEKR